MKTLLKTAAVIAVLFCPQAASAAPVLQPTDFVIAIDTDPPLSLSNSPASEGALNALDGNTATKYLNFGEVDTGILVTPFVGATTVQSMVLWTANDFSSRDPASWAIAGTNDPIDHLAVNNGTSVIPGVTWTPIASGTVALPGTLPGAGEEVPPNPANNGRFEAGPVLSFANTTPYNSYRILFPTTKDPNGVGADSMQISEINLFSTLDGPVSGSNLVSILDSASAFQLPKPDSRYNPGERPAYALDGPGPQPGLPSQSNHPGGEGPANVVNGTLAKYLNFGEVDSGFIVTPASGPAQVRSFQLTTANDAEPRDPSSWQLFGTNAAIMSVNNSYGTAEAWTMIDSGALALPTTRDTLGPVVTVNNASSYSSYKMIFTGVKDAVAANSMQIAEASFFTSVDGTGSDILNPGDPILAIDATVRTGLESKYLNFGENNSGLIVTPAAGAKVVTSLQLTTANDAPNRDPATYQLYGTNDPITSADNSQGNGETWTLIASGDLSLPTARLTDGALISFPNTTSYTSYRIVFPTVRDAAATNSMQIGGLQLFDSSVASDADFDGDSDVDGNDFLIWQRGLGVGTTNATGDADGNGIVNDADLAAWKAAFGAPAVAAVGSVPEPHSAALALFGIAAATATLGARKRR